jgi:hypothetical protein
MDAQRGASRHVGRALGIGFGIATQIAFAATVWHLYWYLYGVDSGVQYQTSHWMLIDALLALQFAVVHSLLLLPRSRSTLTKWMPAGLYGTLFCAATCGGLWLIFLFWRTTDAAVWNLHGVPAVVMRGCFIASWFALFYSLSLSGFGYQTGWTQWQYWLQNRPLPRRGLVDRGAFRWLRHPAYLSFLGLIWFTPRMTLDHAMLTAIWTVYIFVGSVLKDRRLEFYLRDDYREYASRVPGYPGMFWGPLARWPKVSPMAGPACTNAEASKAA